MHKMQCYCLQRVCIFTIFVRLTICSETFAKSSNPGSGMNFYDNVLDTFIVRPEDLVVSFGLNDCSKAPINSHCRPSSFFNDPGFICEYAEPVKCNYSYPYRQLDGTCNNPYFPRAGSVDVCFQHLIAAYYEGCCDFRKSVTGDSLPQPRDISLNAFPNFQQPAKKVTYLWIIYGQFIAHDVSHAVQPATNCCKAENSNKEECAAIPIRPGDPFYSKFNRTCMTFQRSEQCTSCKNVHRSQKNGGSTVLDASIVYGVSDNEVKKLRTSDGTGKLKSTSEKEGYLLPAGKHKGDPFCPKGQDSNCFLSGDPRVNQHASLTAIQTIWMREHNRIATKLKRINPHWEEEKLFQESRKILIATHQCITYKEYLPILLGPRIMTAFDLTVKPGMSGTRFNPFTLLATFQEWTAAGFRLHSMVPPYIGLPKKRFLNTFSNPSLIRKGGILNITRSSYQVPCAEYNHFMSEDLANFLAKQPEKPYGNDMPAIDIQRGRDHGLATYVEVVNFCSARTIEILCFDDLYRLSLMPPENIKLLEQIYNDVNDVDMYVGMFMEYHYPGSMLGPSAVCINAIQFYSIRNGDRFYFDHEGLETSFTPDQRRAVKQQCSIARILCDNTKITHITKNPFLHSDYENPDLPCNEIPNIDLTLWKDTDYKPDVPPDDCL